MLCMVGMIRRRECLVDNSQRWTLIYPVVLVAKMQPLVNIGPPKMMFYKSPRLTPVLVFVTLLVTQLSWSPRYRLVLSSLSTIWVSSCPPQWVTVMPIHTKLGRLTFARRSPRPQVFWLYITRAQEPTHLSSRSKTSPSQRWTRTSILSMDMIFMHLRGRWRVK